MTSVSDSSPPDTANRCACCAEPLDGPPLHGRDFNHGIGDSFTVLTCGACGSGLTRPHVDEADLAGLYPSGYSAYELPERGLEALASRAIRGWQGYLGMRTPPLNALAQLPPGRIVDIGCGRGDVGATLLGRGWEVTGIEPSPEACAVAARRGIDARKGTLATVPLEFGTYDAAHFKHSLEHVSDPLAALRAAGASLRPAGLVLITVPNFGGWQARRLGSRWYHLDLPRHRTHFTPAGLVRLLERAGFTEMRTDVASSTMGLPFSLQYALFGRALFASGLGLRIAAAACTATYPLARALDRLGGGDLLHAVARRAR